VRRLQVLLDALPPESRLHTVIRDGMTQADWDDLPIPEGYGPWSRQEHLLARVADQIAILAWITSRVNGGKGDAPAPLPRPGVGPARTLIDPQEQARVLEYIEHLRTHQGAAPMRDTDDD
jgi:hypothetical protein